MLSQKLRCRPSEVIFLHDELAAWCFDRAVVTYATHVEAEIEAKTQRAKNRAAGMRAAHAVLTKYLYVNEPQAPGRFRDPARF